MGEVAPETVANVALRPVEPADAPFLLDLYAATRADEMALVPWSDAEKHLQLFRRLGFFPGEEQGMHVFMKWSGAA